MSLPSTIAGCQNKKKGRGKGKKTIETGKEESEFHRANGKLTGNIGHWIPHHCSCVNAL
jgi:hypothetical protein